MGCNQSRKEHTFSADELKKLRNLHQKTANSYPETKGKDDLSVQAFRDLFEENVLFGERLHAFMLKLSTTERVDVETFIDVLELLISKSSNKRLNDMFQSQDKVGLLCMVLFPHLRKTLQNNQNNRNSLISYSESLDFSLCILRMFNAQPDQKVNEATARSITDRIFPTNDTKIEFWSFGMLIKEQINLIGSLIHIYLKGKFLDGTVSFLMPKMPDIEKQQLIGKDELTRLYLNNQYLLNACELRLLYQANSANYNFEKLVQEASAFQGQTFVLLQFQDQSGQSYTVGGFNPAKWQGNNSDAVECYVFSLSPKYRHFYPVLDQLGSRPVFRQQFVLNLEGGYGGESGIAFGSSKDDSRIWLDGKSLRNSVVRNNEKFFKKGALIPANAPNPVCTLVEIYGVRTDLTKKNFSYSSTNVGQLSSILSQTRDIRSTLSGSTYESQQFGFRSNQEYGDENVKRSVKRTVVTVPASSASTYSYTTPNQVPTYQSTTSYSTTSRNNDDQYGDVVKRSAKTRTVETPAAVNNTYQYTDINSTPSYSVSQPSTTSYLYSTAQPVTTTTTYSYQPLSNSVNPSNSQQRSVAIDALTKKYEAIAQQNGNAPRSTLPADYSSSYASFSAGQAYDNSNARSSSIPTYQAYSFTNVEGQKQY